MLDPPMSEKEIVRCVKRHFDKEISREIRPSVIVGVKEMVKLLEEIEDEKRIQNEKRYKPIANYEQKGNMDDRRLYRSVNRVDNNGRTGQMMIGYRMQNNCEDKDKRENRIERFDRNRYDNYSRSNMNRDRGVNYDRSQYRYNNRYNGYDNNYKWNRGRNEINWRNDKSRTDRRIDYERRQRKPVIEFPISDEEERRTYSKIDKDSRLEPRDRRFQVQQSDQKSRSGQRVKKVVAIERQECKGNRREK